MSHHPTLYATGRHGCWADCGCGWRSRLWRTVVGAHLDFGRHLLATPTTRRETEPETDQPEEGERDE